MGLALVSKILHTIVAAIFLSSTSVNEDFGPEVKEIEGQKKGKRRKGKSIGGRGRA